MMSASVRRIVPSLCYSFFSSEGKWTCLPTHVDDDKRVNKKALFVAVRGDGAVHTDSHALPRSCSCCRVRVPAPWQRLRVPRLARRELSFPQISREWTRGARHPRAHGFTGQVWYAALACGEGGGEVYKRLPVARHGGSGGGGYQEKTSARI